jgi:hypothetical protein
LLVDGGPRGFEGSHHVSWLLGAAVLVQVLEEWDDLHCGLLDDAIWLDKNVKGTATR